MPDIRLDIDADGIGIARLATEGRSINTLTFATIDEIGMLAIRLAEDQALKGLVITSARTNSFMAGADLIEMEDNIAAARAAQTPAERGDAMKSIGKLGDALRLLERCGKPVAAAINGTALGGGLELALACHYRVVADQPELLLGLPETTIGLMPGAGGTQRLPRLIGIEAALPMILDGGAIGPRRALEIGLVDSIAPEDALLDEARLWVAGHPRAAAAWDAAHFTASGGAVYSKAGQLTMMTGIAKLRRSSFGNYPAQEESLKAVFEGLQLPIDAGLAVERRRFFNTIRTPQAEAMTRSLFHSRQALTKRRTLADGEERFAPTKVGVIGAGMMGAGIAYVQALAGIETVLIDVEQDAADRGKARGTKLLDGAVAKGRLTPDRAAAAAARITPTSDYSRLDGAELIIEAVFEDPALKGAVMARAQAAADPLALLASNTSTLPIDRLAQAVERPGAFLGIHFFSPVDRMQLVEIIRGPRTAEASILRAIDYVAAIGKTPIVVNDSRGFYTSRVFATYLSEGFEMLGEGIAPAIVDQVGRMASMPRGPLELADDVGLDLIDRIAKQTAADLGSAYVPGRQYSIVDALVNTHGRAGRKNRRGLFDYPEDKGPKKLWPGLAELVPVTIATSTPTLVAKLRKRLLYRQVIEAARCVDEGVIVDPRQVDLGAILAWGFPSWTGGPLSYVDMVGAAAFVSCADALAERHGPRFSPPALLRRMGDEGGRFHAGTRAA